MSGVNVPAVISARISATMMPNRPIIYITLCLGLLAPCVCAQDLCDALGVCRASFDLPTGFEVKKCGRAGTPCGIRVKTKTVSPCTGSVQSVLVRAEAGCRCAGELADWLGKSPALIRAGVRDAADPFTGVTSPILSGAAAAGACLINAGLQAKDVNKQQLLDELAASQPATALAGVRAYNITHLPPITLASYLDLATRVTGCVGTLFAGLGNPAVITAVPLVCQSLVDFVAGYLDATLRMLVGLVAELLQPAMDYVEELLNTTGNLFAALDLLVSDITWKGYLATARQIAADKGCADPSTCFGGLLSDAFRELQKLPVALNGTHQAFTTLQVASNTASDFLRLTRQIFCDGAKQLNDASFRKLSLYKALALAVSGEEITPEKLIEHPRILARMAAQFAGLPHLATLEQLAATLKSQVAEVQAQLDQAIADFPGKAYKELDDLYTRVSNELNPPPNCPDGEPPASCFADLCSAPFTPPACGAGQRCVTDRCAGCGPKCERIPPSAADAEAAYAVFVAWYEALRNNQDLKQGTETVKALVPALVDSLLYLNSAISGGVLEAAAADALRYGILTYNRRASASLNVPCRQGNAEKCFRFQKWKACLAYPKYVNCRVGTEFPLPNEHIPWVAVHAGIDDLLLTALGRLTPSTPPVRKPPGYGVCI